ncbi:MAG: hypothetical protein ACM3TR_20150 [Caulobacteraceae bacterium]
MFAKEIGRAYLHLKNMIFEASADRIRNQYDRRGSMGVHKTGKRLYKIIAFKYQPHIQLKGFEVYPHGTGLDFWL